MQAETVGNDGTGLGDSGPSEVGACGAAATRGAVPSAPQLISATKTLPNTMRGKSRRFFDQITKASPHCTYTVYGTMMSE